MIKVYTIYKATNKINEKSYIGFDSNWPSRKYSHKKADGSCPYFHSAIKKYGFDNFEWEAIYQSLDYEHTLKIMEPYFIEQFYENYNLTLGGEGSTGFSPSKEHRDIISKTHKGKILSEETKSRLSSINKGTKLSEDHKKKMSDAHKKRWAKIKENLNANI